MDYGVCGGGGVQEFSDVGCGSNEAGCILVREREVCICEEEES